MSRDELTNTERTIALSLLYAGGLLVTLTCFFVCAFFTVDIWHDEWITVNEPAVMWGKFAIISIIDSLLLGVNGMAIWLITEVKKEI